MKRGMVCIYTVPAKLWELQEKKRSMIFIAARQNILPFLTIQQKHGLISALLAG
jgi:hypothetical protein